MTTSIFIRSYRGDRAWLDYSLRAINKYAHGFHEVIVALPVGDELHFENYDAQGAKVIWFNDPAGEGYTAQQACKLAAHTMCAGDRILYVDSDAMALRDFTPLDFQNEDGKPIQLIRHWADVGDAHIWKPITAKALGVEPTFEHMACLPILHERRTLELLTPHMEKLHSMSLGNYIQTQPFREFSEFNLMGAYAQRYLPHLYDWRIADPATDEYPRCFKQFWSWDGIDKHRAELDAMGL